MGFIIRGFIWDIPILIFAYVLFWGPSWLGAVCGLVVSVALRFLGMLRQDMTVPIS